MPAIHLFGRRSILGGDDLQVPCILAIALRTIQLTAFLIPIWWHIVTESQKEGSLWNYIWYDHDDFNCRTSHMMPLLLVIYSLVSTIVAVVSLILEIRLFQASNIGCPVETQPRSQKVERILEFKIVPMGIIQCLIASLGVATVCFAKTYYDCWRQTTNGEMSALQDDDFWRKVTWEGTDTNPPLLWWIAYAFLWLSQFVEVLATIVTWVKLCRPRTEEHVESLQHELVEAMWAERCSGFCQFLGRSTCFLFGGRNMSMGEYGDVARALADYLEGSLDLVASDIVMGFMVLQKIQRKRILESRTEVRREASELRQQQSRESQQSSQESTLSPIPRRHSFYLMHHEGSEPFYESTSRKVLNMNKTLDRRVLQEGTRFSRYQLAIYTWLLYVYGNPVSGLARLLCKGGCGCCCSRRSPSPGDDEEMLMGDLPEGLVVGDNWCQVHKTALMLQAGIDDDTCELVYAQLHSSFADIPYCIIVDHAWKSVVLAIRGTFSLEDCVTDVLIEPISLEELGEEHGFDGTDQYCHGGVMACSRIVYRDLQRHGILDKLLVGDTARYPEYSLRVVGHSLGAGTATIISYMLRRKFPDLRCINYSPPGATVTWRLAKDCHDWCSTFVLDSDLVPRLSLQALEHLRDEVVDLVGRVKVPKLEVAARTLPKARFFCGDNEQNHDIDALADLVDELLADPNDLEANSRYQIQLQSFRSVQDERRSSRGDSRTVMMYPPGRIVHFMKTGEKSSWKTGLIKLVTCCTTNWGSQYTPVWVKNNDLNEIVVSMSMGTDHFPNRLTDTMQNLADEYGIDATEHCSFEGVVPGSDLGLSMSASMD